MSEFAVVINAHFESGNKAIVLDTVDDVSINSTTTITTQPVVTGDVISDHMFKNPKSISITGSCSLNGSNTIVVEGGNGKLANFQSTFEEIQNNGILCDVYKISVQNDKDIRFLQRTNCVINGLHWTEKINSLDFSIAMTQVIVADVVEYDVDIDDNFLPNITEPKTTSFTNTLMNMDEVLASTIEILKKESLITNEFLNFMVSVLKTNLVITAVGIIVVAAIALASNPVGWVVGALAVGYFIVKGIWSLFKKKRDKRKYAVEKFELVKNSKKNQQSAERFADFMNDIYQGVENLNNVLHTYQISTDGPQEAMISVGDEYYIFTFSQNNIDKNYSLVIENVDKSNVKEFANLSATLTDFSQATSSNYMIKARNNSRIYLMCPSEEKNVLTNYFILVSDINPEDYNKLLNDIINKYIFK